MREGVHTYYIEGQKDEKGRKATTIQNLSDILNLKIEILSDEPGIGFGEHYYYEKGECIEDECIDYPEFEIDDDIYEYEGLIGDKLNFEYVA